MDFVLLSLVILSLGNLSQTQDSVLEICLLETSFDILTLRPDMMKRSTSLRLYGAQNCPTLAMSATATQDEVNQVVASLGLRSLPVILASSPIQSHIKFSVLRRPATNFGLDGNITASGVRNPGLMDLLMRIYLKDYIEYLEYGREPKKCIIFFRGNTMLADVYLRLMNLTEYR